MERCSSTADKRDLSLLENRCKYPFQLQQHISFDENILSIYPKLLIGDL